MTSFGGLDVSQKTTAICIVEAAGTRIWRGVCSSTPEAIARTVRNHAGDDVRVGFETGPMTRWLVHGLRERELDVVCLDARHARAALKMHPPLPFHVLRTRNLGELGPTRPIRMMPKGWRTSCAPGGHRPVHVKSFEAHRARALLGARAHRVGMTTRLSNHIRGVLKTFGLLLGVMLGLRFDRRVELLVADRPEVAAIVQPMLVAWRQLREQIAAFDKAVRAQVRHSSECRLLISVPGVGVLSALAFVNTIEHSERFRRSRTVGAHLGLTPRQYQAGEIDQSGHISRCGDSLVRTLMYEAAVTLLSRVKRASALKGWAIAVAKRSGPPKARVALAWLSSRSSCIRSGAQVPSSSSPFCGS